MENNSKFKRAKSLYIGLLVIGILIISLFILSYVQKPKKLQTELLVSEQLVGKSFGYRNYKTDSGLVYDYILSFDTGTMATSHLECDIENKLYTGDEKHSEIDKSVTYNVESSFFNKILIVCMEDDEKRVYKANLENEKIVSLENDGANAPTLFLIEDSEDETFQDVKKRNFCEVDGCHNIGLYQIKGFSGEIEYYCYDHYKEIEDTINMMYEDVYGN